MRSRRVFSQPARPRGCRSSRWLTAPRSWRSSADVISAEQRATLEWSLAAQRAIARAALRPDGLAAILRELEKRLRCWVALFDGVGDQIRVATTLPMPPGVEDTVQQRVREVIARGGRAGVRLSTPDGEVTLQTLGQRDRLRGVLVVGSDVPLDPAGNDLVASVMALASIALEQSRALEEARRDLRAGLLELLLAGNYEVAHRSVKRLWGRLPAAPVRLGLMDEADVPEALLTELELLMDRSRGRLFFAARDGKIVIFTRDGDEQLVDTLARRFSVPAGLSSPIPWSALGQGLSEARSSAARCSPEHPVVRYESIIESGMLGLMSSSGAVDASRRVLEPVRSVRPDADLLLVTAATWLSFNGAYDPASKALGIHRHTLKSRLAVIEDLLRLNLDDFADRSELWTALHFSDIVPVRGDGDAS
jgi:purine catabolism regulator